MHHTLKTSSNNDNNTYRYRDDETISKVAVFPYLDDDATPCRRPVDRPAQPMFHRVKDMVGEKQKQSGLFYSTGNLVHDPRC